MIRRLVAIGALILVAASCGITVVRTDSNGNPIEIIVKMYPHCDDRGPGMITNRYKCWHLHQRRIRLNDGTWIDVPTAGAENGQDWHAFLYINEGDYESIIALDRLSLQLP